MSDTYNLSVGDKSLEIGVSERLVYIPNEIFTVVKDIDFKSPSHLLFVVVYYSLSSWAYRYSKIFELNELFGSFDKGIRTLTGVNPENKKLNYLTKSGGAIDSVGVTETSHISNAPIENEYVAEIDLVVFSFLDSFEHEFNSRETFKIPLLQIQDRSVGDVSFLGAFDDIEYTFEFDVVEYGFMRNVLEYDYKMIGFYYYLKTMQSVFGKGFSLSREQMSEHTGLSASTITRYRNILTKDGLTDNVNRGMIYTGKKNTMNVKKVSDIYECFANSE